MMTATQSGAAPEDEEIARLTASLAERIPKLLQLRSLGPEGDPEESDPLDAAASGELT